MFFFSIYFALTIQFTRRSNVKREYFSISKLNTPYTFFFLCFYFTFCGCLLQDLGFHLVFFFLLEINLIIKDRKDNPPFWTRAQLCITWVCTTNDFFLLFFLCCCYCCQVWIYQPNSAHTFDSRKTTILYRMRNRFNREKKYSNRKTCATQ